MIDPTNITNYNLTIPELEERLLFWVCTAGKNGATAAKCLEKFLSSITYNNDSPFKALRKATRCAPGFPYLMKLAGIGCYTSKSKTFAELAYTKLNLKVCTIGELESIYGIGMKTSRCFILHSRKDAQVAGLDTHILKHLRAEGIEDVPKQTPSSRRLYARLEKELLKLASNARMSPADYDLSVWKSYTVK